MQITHIGHACLLLEASRGTRLLIDPGSAPFVSGYEDLTGLDAILVTHQHQDHVDADRLRQLLTANPGARLLVEPETARALAESGLDPAALDGASFAAGQRVEVGGTVIEGVGGQHAVIHRDLPRVGNTGLVVRTEGGPTVFHPGDMIDTAPDGVDVLAVPLNAPWAAFKETVDFVRAVRPRLAFPIHDALLSQIGRALYLRQVTALAPQGCEVHDLAGAGAVAV